MSAVDLRLLRYFVAVAEEGSFTRAAGRLSMTQPALSRAIRSLESVVGASLLERGYREVAPTAAGRVLLQHARDIDERTTAAIRLARRAAAAVPQLRVTAPGADVLLLDELVSTFNRTGPTVPAVALVASGPGQSGQLRDGTAEVGLIRAPFDRSGLDSEEYRSEPRVVLLRGDDPLAARRGVELRQLVGLPIIRGEPGRADGLLLWPPDEARPDGWRAGPTVTDTSEISALVRLGQGVALVPESVGVAGPGVRAMRIVDCPPSTVRIAWVADSTARAVAELVRFATGPTSPQGSPADHAPAPDAAPADRT